MSFEASIKAVLLLLAAIFAIMAYAEIMNVKKRVQDIQTTINSGGSSGGGYILPDLTSPPADFHDLLYVQNGELYWSGSPVTHVLPGIPGGITRYTADGRFVETVGVGGPPLIIPVEVQAPEFTSL